AAAPNGMIGLETALPLMLELVRSNRLPALSMRAALTAAPARVSGIDAGALAVGGAGDVTVIDPERRWKVETFVSKSRNSPFVGREVQGRVVMTLVAGDVVFDS